MRMHHIRGGGGREGEGEGEYLRLEGVRGFLDWWPCMEVRRWAGGSRVGGVEWLLRFNVELALGSMSLRELNETNDDDVLTTRPRIL